MFSKKLFIGISGIALAIVVALCVVLPLTLGGNDEDLKINQNQIEIAYGDTFNLSKVTQVLDKFSFKIEDTDIAKIENNKIVTLACGKTKLYVSKRTSRKEKIIELIIYAKTIAFNKASITLHTSGDDTYANFSLIVNGLTYNKCKLSFDNNIISVEDNCVFAKFAGKTQISATILGNSCSITANLEVNVKNYVYAKNIIDDTIYMNIGTQITKTFIEYENVVGDKIDTEFIYDNKYLSYENGILTAHKVGTTQIVVNTFSSNNTTISKSIIVEIAPQLEVTEYSFMKGDSQIDTLLYSTKADGTPEVYKLHLTFNKSILGLPTFAGIVTSNIESTSLQTFDVTFTKLDNSNIIIFASDPNTKCAETFYLEIPLQKFIQTIDFCLVDDNATSRDCLYLFNNDYETNANDDGYFNSLAIKTSIDNVVATKNFTMATDSTNIEINKKDNTFVVKALSVGSATITISATDDSGAVCTKNINVEKVIPSEITFANVPENLFLYDTFSLVPTFAPSYALTNFEVTFENGKTFSQYFANDSNDKFSFQAIKYGSANIKILENNSKIEHTYNLTILQEFTFIYNYKEIDSEKSVLKISTATSITISIFRRIFENGEIGSTTKFDNAVIEIFTKNKELIYSTNNAVHANGFIIAKIDNEITFIDFPLGEYSLQISKDGKVVATLTIIVE